MHLSNAEKLVAHASADTDFSRRVIRRTVQGRDYVRSDFVGAQGQTQLELWMVEGTGHAWSSGRASETYTDAKGPDASAQMIRFFLQSQV